MCDVICDVITLPVVSLRMTSWCYDVTYDVVCHLQVVTYDVTYHVSNITYDMHVFIFHFCWPICPESIHFKIYTSFTQCYTCKRSHRHCKHFMHQWHCLYSPHHGNLFFRYCTHISQMTRPRPNICFLNPPRCSLCPCCVGHHWICAVHFLHVQTFHNGLTLPLLPRHEQYEDLARYVVMHQASCNWKMSVLWHHIWLSIRRHIWHELWHDIWLSLRRHIWRELPHCAAWKLE